MNNISWFIYLADVISNIQGLLLFAGVTSVGCLLVYLMNVAMHNDLADSKYNDKEKIPYSKVFRWWWIPILCFTLFSFIPSYKTMYMIAASEIGEQVVKTPEAVEIFEALKTKILSELKVN